MHVVPLQNALIGVMDSGIGGLSVLREIRAALPGQPLLYLADAAHVPYGPRPPAEVRGFVRAITHFLRAEGASVIVLACHSASAAALHALREEMPGVPFVGLEPAVKPAAACTRTGVIGVLATAATLQSTLYRAVVARHANGCTVLEDACPGLVSRIEAGDLDGDATRAILRRAIDPMRERGMDALVLGCTHYPLVLPLVSAIAGSGVTVIDPAAAVARRVRVVLEQEGIAPASSGLGDLRMVSTGDAARLSQAAESLLGRRIPCATVAWGMGASGPILTGGSCA